MESQIEKIVGEFATNIQQNIVSIAQTIKTIKEKIQILRDTYVDLIEKNNHKQIFLFCLESFNFQNKSMMYESDHLQKTLNILLNRTYRDYYKVYNIILKLFEEYKLENKTQKTHPEYRDLDVNAEFTLEEISNIHDDVIYLTCVLIDKYKESDALIQQYKTKSKTGIYIINLINTIEYDNAILKDQIDLYINYLFFFQNTQTTYLSKLNNKMKNFLKEIENDIDFQDGGAANDIEAPQNTSTNVDEVQTTDLQKDEVINSNEADANPITSANNVVVEDNQPSSNENCEIGVDSTAVGENIGMSVYENPLNSETHKKTETGDKRRGRRNGGLHLFGM